MKGFAWRLAGTAATFGVAGYFATAIANGAAGPERISLNARKFEYSASEIRLKRGKSVTFVLSASDFVHGFNVPDFNVRADLIPGKTVEVTFTPNRAGKFAFVCDNFCGEGHDRMTGFLIVTDE
jgi:cytochrome c oxidase subunit II